MNKQTRIYIEARALASDRVSGVGHSLIETVRALDKLKTDNEDLDIVLIVPMSKVENVKKLAFQNVRLKRMWVPMRIINRLERYRLLPPIDLFLGRGVYIFPNYVNWPLLFSKSLTYVYDVSFILFPDFVSPKNKKYLLGNISKWIRRADRILTISKSAEKDVSKHLNVPEPKLAIIPCGVDTQIFNPRPQTEVNKVKAKYRIGGEYALYVGNIEPRKNIVRLVKAYKKVHDKHPGLKLVVVGGDGWQNQEINNEIDQAKKAGYPIIKPRQYVPDADLPALYSGAGMLVHVALYEGFGISPLQAMACGTPVIVANNSSLPEVVGEAGLYVEEKSVDDIAKKMSLLLEDKNLRKDYSQRGIERARHFSWENSGQELIKVIRESLA